MPAHLQRLAKLCKHGLVESTTNIVHNMCPYIHAGVAVGLLALGELLPTSQSGRTMRLTSWLFIGVGVAMLANGQGESCAMVCLQICSIAQCTASLAPYSSLCSVHAKSAPQVALRTGLGRLQVATESSKALCLV